MQYDSKNRMYQQHQMYVDLQSQYNYQNTYQSPHSNKVAILQTPQMMLSPQQQQQLNQQLVNQIPYQNYNPQAFISQAMMGQPMLQQQQLSQTQQSQIMATQNLTQQNQSLIQMQQQYQQVRQYEQPKRGMDSQKQILQHNSNSVIMQPSASKSSQIFDNSQKTTEVHKGPPKPSPINFNLTPPIGCYTIVRRGNLPEIRFESNYA